MMTECSQNMQFYWLQQYCTNIYKILFEYLDEICYDKVYHVEYTQIIVIIVPLTGEPKDVPHLLLVCRRWCL